jgi:hypothetical protein
MCRKAVFSVHLCHIFFLGAGAVEIAGTEQTAFENEWISG